MKKETKGFLYLLVAAELTVAGVFYGLPKAVDYFANKNYEPKKIIREETKPNNLENKLENKGWTDEDRAMAVGGHPNYKEK